MIRDEVDMPLKNDANLLNHLVVLTTALRHWTWHHPACLLFLVLWGVSKAHSDYAIFGEKILEGFNYGGLWLPLGDVVDY